MAEDLYARLSTAGLDVLLDDREERSGVKFKDADLLGMPVRVTVGTKALARGKVEVKRRGDSTAQEVELGEVANTVDRLIGPL